LERFISNLNNRYLLLQFVGTATRVKLNIV